MSVLVAIAITIGIIVLVWAILAVIGAYILAWTLNNGDRLEDGVLDVQEHHHPDEFSFPCLHVVPVSERRN